MPGFVSTIIDLFEGSLGPRPSLDWVEQFGREHFDHLRIMGALLPAAPATFVNCTACFEGHDAQIEPAANGGFQYYCPDAGWQLAEPSQIEQLRPNIDFLLDLLIGPDGRRGERLGQTLWILDETEFHGERCLLAFARGLKSIAVLNTVIQSLAGVMPPGTGLLITTSTIDASAIHLPHQWSIVPLDQAITVVGSRIELDKPRLAGWAASENYRPHKGSVGRPGRSDDIARAYQLLRDQEKIPKGAKKAHIEKLIRAEWKHLFPHNLKPPGRSTTMRYLRDTNRN